MTASEANRLPPAERYQRDPAFRVLVDQLMYQIRECNYTPTELREAVIFAAIEVENTTLRKRFVLPEGDY
jgi:hypothetical protein